MKKRTSMFSICVAFVFLIVGVSSASAQTTTYTQSAAGPNCQTTGCINTPLSPTKELLTWADTSRVQGFTFRGLTYYATAKRIINPDGSLSVDLDSAAYENNGFSVHTRFTPCYRCYRWHDGDFVLLTDYVGSGTYLYGWNGSVNVTSGTGQVGYGVAQTVDSTVNLMSSRPDLLQVPTSVVIPANQFDADFTITAAAPTATLSSQLAPIPVTVTATFPDNTAATMTVTVGPIPAPPPPPPPDE